MRIDWWIGRELAAVPLLGWPAVLPAAVAAEAQMVRWVGHHLLVNDGGHIHSRVVNNHTFTKALNALKK